MGVQLKVILMIGLPRSGKSTIARDLGYPIVCPDAIRLALHGMPFVGLAEPFVWAIAQVMLYALLLSGHATVIVDATNTTVKRRAMWINDKWDTYAYIVDNGPENVAICKNRAAESEQEYLLPVIDRMVENFEPLSDEEGIQLWEEGIQLWEG